MARKYLFICDACGATVQCDSEALPDGWAIVVGLGALDVCSLHCATRALNEAPQFRALAPASVIAALPPSGSDGP